jgi:hypothetical protein
MASLSPSFNSLGLLEVGDSFTFAVHAEHNLKQHFYAK